LSVARVWRTRTVEETRALGRELAAELLPDRVLLLRGEIGAGKTVLAQGVGEGLGIDPKEIQSPTFTLVREHAGAAARLAHLDLYRLEPHDAEVLGFEELLAGPGVKIVEWSERLPFEVAEPLVLQLQVLEDGTRQIAEQQKE